jgi:DNA-binding beta-propeller fold protein YncE
VVIAYIPSNLIKKHFVILRPAYKLMSGNMMFKYPFKALLITTILVILFDINTSLAQAPDISYPTTSQHYTTGTTITPLSPENKGGDVPADTYGLVSTFAGNGKNGAANGQGPGESFKLPNGIAVDQTGYLYVTDQSNNSVLKIDPAGNVVNLALHFASPPGQFAPYGIVAGNSGNLFAADPYANVIWKIDALGNATVFAGGSQGATDGQCDKPFRDGYYDRRGAVKRFQRVAIYYH